MPYSDDIAEYSLSLDGEGFESTAQLELFQSFCALYNGHRDLLDGLLYSTGKKAYAPIGYIQGIGTEDDAYLLSNLASKASEVLRSSKQLWLVGRDRRQVDITLEDRRLSRRHAALQYRPGKGFVLLDLSSTNGTYVNGTRLEPEKKYLLQDGDWIRLGRCVFQFFTCYPTNVDPQQAENQNASERSLEEDTLH